MPQQLKNQLIQVFWIIISWTLISLFDFLIRYGIIDYFDITITSLNIHEFLIQSIFVGVVAGIFGGSILIFLWNKWLRAFSYGRVLLGLFLSFTVLFYSISISASLVFNNQNVTIFSSKNIIDAIQYQFTLSSITNYIHWLFIGLGTLIVLQVNDKYGSGVFQDFLLGKYFRPRREERIFMFLDLRSSTTIAEMLGEKQYFNFLKDVFKHITQPILNHNGEIYQYVGDEVVISWKTTKTTYYTNCMNCFFDIQKQLISLQKYYIRRYGVIPEFKAGIHSGAVMIGEIGVIKRDIVYSGDVLNTTARIQSLCNDMKTNLLISKYFMEKLKNVSSTFQFKKLGNIVLRGKNQPMDLFEVSTIHISQ